MNSAIKVFIQNAAGSTVKNRHNEQSLEHLGSIELLEPYPLAYGFIPKTMMPDGECLDCYLMTSCHVPENSLINAVPIGVLQVFENKEPDHKVLVVLPGEAERVDKILLEQLEQFISRASRQFPDTEFKTGKVLSQADAIQLVTNAAESSP
jgi:inorganic pyrophosphatase